MNSPIHKNHGPTAADFKKFKKRKLGDQLKLPFTVEESKGVLEKHKSHIDDVPDIFKNVPAIKCPHLSEVIKGNFLDLHCLYFDLPCKWEDCNLFKTFLKDNNMEADMPYLFDEKTTPSHAR